MKSIQRNRAVQALMLISLVTAVAVGCSKKLGPVNPPIAPKITATYTAVVYSPTDTPTITDTFTRTHTLTRTPTGTSSPSNTFTNTFSPSPTLTSTSTPTLTRTSTVTNTLTLTPTGFVPSNTPTQSATTTLTRTLTGSNTPSRTFTNTSVISDTPTRTSTSTVTRTTTSTRTSTNTRTNTLTSTLTYTPSPTSTPTDTFTDTDTPTETSTFTNTETAVPGQASINQSASSSTAMPGDTITYTLTINVGVGGANAVTVTNDLPSNVTFGTFLTGPAGTLTGSQITWELGDLPEGLLTLEFTVTVDMGTPDGSILDNAASVSGVGFGPNNAASSPVTVNWPTPTVTETLTNTETPTPTACVGAYAPLYPFDSDMECWQKNDDVVVPILSWSSAPPAGASGGALRVDLDFTGELSQHCPTVFLDFPGPTDLTGAIISYRMHVPTAIQGTAWGFGIQTIVADSTMAYQTSWTNATFGSWQTYTYDMAGTGADPADILRIGVQLCGPVGSLAGSIYFDEVTITYANTPTPTLSPTITETPLPGVTFTDTMTPTITPTPCTVGVLAPLYPFDAGTECWQKANDVVIPVMGWTAAPPAGASGGAVQMSLDYTGQLGQRCPTFQLTFPGPADLTGAVISFRIYAPAALHGTAWGMGMQTFVADTSWSYQTSWTNADFDTWQTYTYDLSTSTADAANIMRIGVQFCGPVGCASGDIFIDEVTITYANTPTPTQTPTITDTPLPGVTLTDTPSPTETPTACTMGSYSALYAFGADTECWQSSVSLVGTTVDWAASPAVSAPGAFHAHVDYVADAQSMEEFYVDFPTPQNLAGKTLEVSVRVNGTAWWGGIQPFVEGVSGWQGTYADTTSFLNNYATFTHVVTGAGTDITRIGVQVILGANSGSPGVNAVDVYIDDVRVLDTVDTPTPTETNTPDPAATPTETPTPCTMGSYSALYAYSADTECWQSSVSLTGTTVGWAASPAVSSPGALHAHVDYVADAQSMEEFYVEFPTSQNLAGKTLEVSVRVNGTAWWGGINPFVDGGSGWQGTYTDTTSFLNAYNTFTHVITAGGTDITKIGVQVVLGANSGSPGVNPVDVYIDDVRIVDGAPVDTPTPTETMPVYTPTETPTYSACTMPVLKDLYTYDMDDECWTTAGMATWLTQTTSLAYGGVGCLQLEAPFTATGESRNVEAYFGAAGVDLTGRTLGCWVRFSPEVMGSGAGHAQLYLQSGAGSVWASGAYTTIANADQWYHLTWTPMFCNAGEDSTNVRQFGVQVISGDAGTPTTGYIYIDEFTADLPPTATGGYYFETGMESWHDNGAALTATLSWAAGGYGGSAGYLNATVPFTGPGQQCDVAVDPPGVSVTITNGVRMSVFVPLEMAGTGGGPGAQVLVQSSTWGWNNSSWINLTAGCWNTISFTPTYASGGNGNGVKRIGVQLFTGSAGSGQTTSNVRIDNVVYY